MYELLLDSTSTTSQLSDVASPIVDLINSVVPVALTLVVAIGALYAIVLGVKYAKADEPQEHEKAKKGLINAIVGFVLIFVLIVMLRLLTPVMVNWMNTNSSEVTVTDMTKGTSTQKNTNSTEKKTEDSEKKTEESGN